DGYRQRSRFGHAHAFAIEREPHADARALSYATADLDIAAVQPDQPFHDRQSETGAAMTAIVARTRLEIRLADAREILLVNTDAIVFDHERHAPGVHAGADGNPAATIGKA